MTVGAVARPSVRFAPLLSALNHRRLLLIVTFMVIASFDLARETDIDFWWHLRTGELIAQSGAVPTADPFSYTAHGQPWVVHEWLWELVVYHLYQRGGYVLAVLLSAVMVTLTYAILYHLLRRLGANERLAVVLVLGAAALGLPNLGVRPRELSFLFLTVYLHRLVLYREGRVRTLWLLPLLMLLWANVHGGFVLGLSLIALFAAGALIEWWFLGAAAPRHVAAAGIATVLAAMVNPSGPQLLLYPLGYYSEARNPSFSIVTEFQSPNFHQPLMLLFAGSLALFLALGVRRARHNVVEWLVGTAFIVQALVSVRQVAVCAIVMTPLLVVSLCERYAWARELPPPRQARPLIVLNWVLLAGLVVAGVLFARRPQIAHKLQFGSQPNARNLPVAGVQFIEEHALAEPIFNSQPWGGYLIYRWYPQRRVFMDGRIDMYGPSITEEYLQVVTIKPQWRAVLDKYGVQTLLIEKDSALSVLLLADGGWERVFEGEVEDVFVRRSAKEHASPGAARWSRLGAMALLFRHRPSDTASAGVSDL